MVFLVQQVELNKESGRGSEKQEVKINKMEQRRMQKETKSVQRHVNAMQAGAKFICKHLRYKSSSLLFSLPLSMCLYSPCLLLCLLSWQNLSEGTEGKKRQMCLCGKLLCHSVVHGNHIFLCSLWERDLFFQHFEKDLWFHLDLCTIAFLSVLFIFLWELSH